jgi:hypothetical protein
MSILIAFPLGVAVGFMACALLNSSRDAKPPCDQREPFGLGPFQWKE